MLGEAGEMVNELQSFQPFQDSGHNARNQSHLDPDYVCCDGIH